MDEILRLWGRTRGPAAGNKKEMMGSRQPVPSWFSVVWNCSFLAA